MSGRSPLVLVDHRSLVGESPIWDSDAQLVRWCDIEGGALMAATLDGRLVDVRLFGEPIAALGQVDADTLVVAFRNTVDLVDIKSWRRSRVAEIPLWSASERLNDGKVGPDGAFWIGATDPQDAAARRSRLYRVTADGGVETILDGLGISNGLAWSADGEVMHHADTVTGSIDRWRFDFATGRLSERTRFPIITRAFGLPDGGCFDRQGAYWSAGVTAGKLNRFSPAGRVLDQIALPIAKPTSICFAGPDFDQAVVTSMSRSQESDPNAGKTLIMDLGVVGFPITRFGG